MPSAARSARRWSALPRLLANAPPDALPAGHGRLIRTDDYLGHAPQNGTVTRIHYTTTDAVSREAVASAPVILPTIRRPAPVRWWCGTTARPGSRRDTLSQPADRPLRRDDVVVVAPRASGIR